MTDAQVQALVGQGLVPSRIAHQVNPNDPNFIIEKAGWAPYHGEDPQPGDALEFHTKDGTYQFVFNGADDWDLAGTPKGSVTSAKAPQVRNFGSAAYPDWRQYNADTKAWEPLGGVGGTVPPKLDPADPAVQALAKAAAADPQHASEQGRAAWFAVYGGGQPGQYVMPIPGYSGQIAPHHAGNEKGAVDLFAPPGTPIVAAAGGTVVRAGPYGAAGNDIYIQGDDGRVYDYEHTDGLQVKAGDVVKAGQPLGVVATLENGGSSVGPATHLHFAVGSKDGSINYDDHGTGTDFDTTSFVKGLTTGQPTGGAANPFAPQPEVKTLSPGTTVTLVDPTTGKATVTYTAPQNGHLFQVDNQLFNYDPDTHALTAVGTLPPSVAQQKAQQNLLPKAQQLIQQSEASIAWATNEYKAGRLTSDQLGQYTDLINQNVVAGLQGTTLADLQKTAMEQQTQRAQTAKDLLDTKVQQTTSLATSMLGQALKGVTDSKYGTMAPGTLSGVFQGALDQANQQTAPLSNLAQQLLSGIGSTAANAGLNPRIPPTPAPGMPPVSVGSDQSPVAAPQPAAAA